MKCEYGSITGIPCNWDGPEREMTRVEYRLPQYQGAYRTAWGSGRYPVNNYVRVRLCPACLARLAETENDSVG